MSSDLFITGTDTGVGKTLLSALLVAALNRLYWKPIQTGCVFERTDRETVMKWAGVQAGRTFFESYCLDAPVSPHLAARLEGKTIQVQRIQRPDEPEPLVIEGAGGVLVPINEDATMLDLMRHLAAPIIVATRTTLGTINHTLLTLLAIRQAKLPVRGVVMIGNENVDNRLAIERYGDVPVIGSIPWLETIDRQSLRRVFEQHFDRNAL